MASVTRLQMEELPTETTNRQVSAPVLASTSIAHVVGTFLPILGALATVLAVRLFLLLAVVGSFVLAQAAMMAPSTYGIWILVAYCALTILPLVWLDLNGRSRG